MSCFSFIKLWLGISVLASAAGWILSSLGQLNRAGYLVFGFVALIVALILRRRLGCGSVPGRKGSFWKKIRRRFCRPLPLAFGVLALLIFAGGALYPPTNHTAFTYRIPRILHWLWEGQWHWIHTPNSRMNVRACGIEWLTAPLLLFTKSERSLFLINFIPFLMLPGLVFSVFTRLGVRGRVAWQWMWLLPTGYSFLLQAGSAGNDTFPTVYALAAIDFGCRTWKSRKLSDLWFSFLAAALLTGAKASNLPLLLPWAILIFPLLPLLRQRLAISAAIGLVCALVSFLPTAILNVHYAHDWSGLKLEAPNMSAKNPVVAVWGNAFQLLLSNFAPPLFPQAGWWNANAPALLPHSMVTAVESNFDTGYFILGELPTEDWSGLGFGLSVLLLAAMVASLRRRSASINVSPVVLDVPGGLRRAVLVAAWVSLLAYCVKSGMVTAARLISPYYVLLLPLLLVGSGHSEIVRRRWWRAMTAVVFALAFVVLVLTPPRPLWPAKTFLAKAVARQPSNRLLSRAQRVYSVYARRSDPLADVRALLPSDLRLVGFMGTPDDIEISFWKPYFERRVEHILLSDSAEEIRRKRIQYAVVGGFNLAEKGTTLEAWLNVSGAECVATTNATLKVAEGSQPWHIVRLKD